MANMVNARSIRAAALGLGVLVCAAVSARAQGTMQRPPIRTPVTTRSAVMKRRPVQRAHLTPTQKVGIDPSRPFDQSLVVSTDGIHYAPYAEVTYTDPCPAGMIPAGCGVQAPQIPLYFHWNATNIPANQQFHVVEADPSHADGAYFSLLAENDACPVDGAYHCCRDQKQAPLDMHRAVYGPPSTSDFRYPGIFPNTAETYVCAYHVSAQVISGTTAQNVHTNTVTVTVRIVNGGQ